MRHTLLRVARTAWLPLCALGSGHPRQAAAQDPPAHRAVVVFRLGGPDAPDEYAFPRTPQLIVDSAGFIFARVAPDGAVSVFDPTGRFVRRIGRKGSGPGEFQSAAGHGLVGDTLWVRNWPTPRISLFLKNGTHVRTSLTPFDYGRAFSAPTGITGFLRAGRAYAFPTENALGSRERVSVPVVVGDRAMRSVDTIANVSSPGGLFIPGVGTFTFTPFRASPLVRVSSDGSIVAVAAWSSRTPGTLDLRLISARGTQLLRRELTFPSVAIPRRVRDSLIDIGVAKARPHVERAQRGGALLATPIARVVEDGLDLPSHYPPIHDAVIGVDGTIWLERATSASRGSWLVLDQRGAARFTVQLPASFQLHQASANSVWGVDLDDLGVAYLLRYRIERG